MRNRVGYRMDRAANRGSKQCRSHYTCRALLLLPLLRVSFCGALCGSVVGRSIFRCKQWHTRRGLFGSFAVDQFAFPLIHQGPVDCAGAEVGHVKIGVPGGRLSGR